MKKIVKAFKLIGNPSKLVVRLNSCGFAKLFSDSFFLRCEYKHVFDKKLNLEDPKTYNEKIQWLKLYDRKPEYSRMVDKYEAKKYVAEKIGDEYIIPTLGVWDKFDDIDFNSLPSQFVLKCTHDSGGLVICKDKSKFDVETARKKINWSLNRKYFYAHREWPYKNVRPRIIAERYMEDSVTEELRDYKFFCFDGQVKALFIASDRTSVTEETKFDFFDADYTHLPFTNGHPNAAIQPAKPQNFELMKKLSQKLSSNIPHVRVDFYECNGKVYFGELTFSHWSGIVPFDPPEWDKTFGDWIKLPEKVK
ncbi:MAG: glycosyl transferase [Ruminococcaceae bacterium]|nr:glycosyl transferase [Oscillospiraceae bacterium]